MRVAASELLFTGLTCVIWNCIQRIDAFSTATVPPLLSVCRDMLPQHQYKPQESQAPYEIIVTSVNDGDGCSVNVTLKSSIPGAFFRGFYLQGRRKNTNIIGSFRPNLDVKLHNCADSLNNAAYHRNGKVEKSSVNVCWVSPENFTEEVIFISTFVKDFENIWTRIRAHAVAM